MKMRDFKQKKSYIAILTACFVFMSATLSFGYGYKTIKVGKNYAKLYMDNYDFRANKISMKSDGKRETLLVGMREIYETLNYKVAWDPMTKISTFSKNGTVIRVDNNTHKIYYNDIPVMISTKIRVMDGRLFIPLDTVSFLGGYLPIMEVSGDKTNKKSYEREVTSFSIVPLSMTRPLSINKTEEVVFTDMANALVAADLPNFEKKDINQNLILNFAIKNILERESYSGVKMDNTNGKIKYTVKIMKNKLLYFGPQYFGKEIKNTSLEKVLNSDFGFAKYQFTNLSYKDTYFYTEADFNRSTLKNRARIFAMNNVKDNIYDVYFNVYTEQKNQLPIFEGVCKMTVELRGSNYYITGWKNLNN